MGMDSLNFSTMQQLQKQLQEKYRDKWGGLSPEKGRQTLLWLYGEAGEVGDIMKKQGDDKILEDSQVRRHFVEEMCDILMYFNDLMLCYHISPQELEEVYLQKHGTNMQRW